MCQDAIGAAHTALTLALLRITRGEVTVGTAWSRRAARLLEDVPPRMEHAYLAYLDASLGMYDDGEPWSTGSVARLAALIDLVGDDDVAGVSALAAVVAGMHDLRRGDPESGFAHLDEAMLSVTSGEIEPEWAGDMLCTTIHTCHELADFGRMADWTRATERWSADYGADAVYAGVCRVHRLELQSAEGDWAGAEDALERACAVLERTDPWVAGEGWYALGELRRLRGDGEGARRAFALSRAAGIDPSPGEALLELSEGRVEPAWASLSASLAGRDRLARTRLLRAGVQIALARRDASTADDLADELERTAREYGTEGFRAWSAHARGMVLLARGRPTEALASLHEALHLFRRLRLRWEQAHVLTWIADVHAATGDVAGAQARADAEAIVAEIGARPIASLLAPETSGPPAPLTVREAEILALAARGAANRDIAGELFISEKTVGRHLANIYLKLGVSSRTAAAAWWHEHR